MNETLLQVLTALGKAEKCISDHLREIDLSSFHSEFLSSQREYLQQELVKIHSIFREIAEKLSE